MRNHGHTITKFVIVGTTATVSNLALVYIATEKFGWWYLASSVLGFVVGITISFVFQKLWTFSDHTRERVPAQATLFLTVALGGLAFNSVFVWILVETAAFHYLVAQIVSGIFIASANFVFYRTLIFSLPAIARAERFLESGLINVSVWPVLLICTALITRIPGLALSYYQDEWKFGRAISEGINTASGLYHPPLTELLYMLDGYLFGAEQLRVMPVLFFAASVALLCAVLYRRVGIPGALLGSALYAVSMYGFLGSLMVDTDGAILPFFFLLSVLAYDNWRGATGRRKILYAFFFVAALLAGFLVKLSFVLVPAALAVDWLIERRHALGMRALLILGGAGAAFLVIFAIVIVAVHWIFPLFDIVNMIEHARSYMHLDGRNFSQVAFQFVKALFYLSPLLIAPLLLISRKEWERYRVFFLYLFLGLVFYLVLFDFSRGALDKYFLFTVAPISAIAGGILARLLASADRTRLFPALLVGAGLCALLLALLTLTYDVLPLYPKRAWLEAVLSGHWSILMPFMGGSGPPAFYMPLLFLAASWIVAIFAVLVAWFRPRFNMLTAVVLVFTGITYNGVFAAEFIYGSVYGSSSRVLADALQYIRTNDSISSVVTYNDYGAFELWKMGKYEARFYADPVNEASIRERFAGYGDSAFLVVDVPRLNQEQFYGSFISSCEPLYTSHDKLASAIVYDCSDAVRQL